MRAAFLLLGLLLSRVSASDGERALAQYRVFTAVGYLCCSAPYNWPCLNTAIKIYIGDVVLEITEHSERDCTSLRGFQRRIQASVVSVRSSRYWPIREIWML